MKLRLLPFTGLALLLFSVLALCLKAQGQTNNQSGKTGFTYSKSTKDKISKVKMTFVSEDGKIRKEIVSDDNGHYRIELPEGRYKITAIRDGYDTYSTESGFSVVQAGKMMTANIFMAKTGQAKQKVKVTAKKQTDSGFKIVEQKARAQVGILVEYFKLDHRTANKLIREYAPKAANAGELRKTLGEMIGKGEAELIETAWTRGLSGQRVKAESVSEEIYPTEYDAPEINDGNSLVIRKKQTVEQTIKDLVAQRALKVRENMNNPTSQIHLSSAMPTAFETRNVGLTLEVDPVISSDNTMIDLSLSPEIVTRLEDQHITRPGFEKNAHGIDNISLASFYVNKTTLQIKAIPGNYNLLGLHTPYTEPDKRIIALLKADLFHAK